MDALTTCNACGANEADPDSAAGYCAECEAEARARTPRSLPPDPEAECLCHWNPETGFRFDIVCPRHDGVYFA